MLITEPGDWKLGSAPPERDGSRIWVCPCGETGDGATSYCQRCGAPGPASMLGALLGTQAHAWATGQRPRSRRRRAHRVSAAVALALLVAAAVSAAASSRRGAHPRGEAMAEVTNPERWGPDPVLRRLAGYVEQARRLRFLRPVAVTWVDPATMRTMGSGTLLDFADAAGQMATLRALGLTRGAGQRSAAPDARAGDVVGLYDIATKQIYLRSDLAAGPYRGFVLVHELTHALQDQHFDLGRPYGDSADAARAAVSLVEGDAERVAESYLGTLTPHAMDTLEREALARRDELYRGMYFQSADVFPYSAGPAFVRALLERGGQSLLDAAFRSYPASTAQVVHPERYLRGDRPVPVPEPPADGAIVARGVLGEFDLSSVLLAGGLDIATSTRASEGWGGASYVTWLSKGRPCARVRVVMDTAAATTRLAAALQRWTAARGGAASLSGSAPLTLTACEHV